MPESEEVDARPVRAFLPYADLRVDESRWPASIPAVAQLLREGLEIPAGLTVLVGENGSGKSTAIETPAEAYGRPAVLFPAPVRGRRHSTLIDVASRQ